LSSNVGLCRLLHAEEDYAASTNHGRQAVALAGYVKGEGGVSVAELTERLCTFEGASPVMEYDPLWQ
ncbi:hypothetical protein CYMTET_54913, partial [Cymbomonas tetramitiformis]